MPGALGSPDPSAATKTCGHNSTLPLWHGIRGLWATVHSGIPWHSRSTCAWSPSDGLREGDAAGERGRWAGPTPACALPVHWGGSRFKQRLPCRSGELYCGASQMHLQCWGFFLFDFVKLRPWVWDRCYIYHTHSLRDSQQILWCFIFHFWALLLADILS